MSACKSCGEPLVWAETEPKADKATGEITQTGRRIPLDADPDNPGHALQREDGNLVFTGAQSATGSRLVRYVPAGRGRHVTHFATCVNADKHRKAKR